MPYRPPSPRQRDAQARKLATMRAGRDRARMASPAPDYPPVLPELRRVVTITDYDTGEPVTHELRLLRSRRVDSYRVLVDGQPWHQAACERIARAQAQGSLLPPEPAAVTVQQTLELP